MSLDEQRRARDWADTESLKLARELLEKRVCVDCHDVTRGVGRQRLRAVKVAPVRLTQNWMPRARFNHAATSPNRVPRVTTRPSAPNTAAHPDAGHHEMPECHGGAGDTSKLSSDCVMCHRFHLPNRGRFDTQQPQARLPQ